MKFGCPFENAQTPKEIRTPPVQGYLLEVLAEAGDTDIRLLMIGQVRKRDWNGKLFVGSSYDRKVLPKCLQWEAVVGVEGFDKGLALVERARMHGGPPVGVVEYAQALNRPVARARIATPTRSRSRAANRMPPLVAENTDTCSLFCPVQEFGRQRRPKRKTTNKRKLTRVDNQDDP
jgi:hypothetical protein